ncbi:3-oxoacyl-ACP reductase FabG [Symbiobacterium thermophilum]|uniref:3-oxoacyl-(Acyl-carrier protein) reductase n=2 Tax=Symbiobacterium thermophilum TaxID=2734 RepID=Q67RA3_SYMTH|nr:3-oxoacyl-ACP reductase FabG [Symbiobacterium thermophilum]MBY6277161.1 3-oxoacyl-ACP reductase FabG [Symbiobacterium thermophilum]OTA41962.1 MAG: 3-oxoacyl-ACP reductase [Symbiobacterium thermophilum]BAD39790.1 3-oxoacyl-(acyl-carrier protein) reductase [Symbiobacterium thermophilum IAM 14863]
MERELTGKVALVTGAARGLGRAIALEMAARGADVIVNDVPDMAEVAAETVAAAQALGVKARFYPAFVNDEEQVNRMAAEVGQVDILVNNAGVNRDGTMRKSSKADWDLVIDVNLTGTFNCLKAFTPAMRERRWGRVINIASYVGRTGVFGTPYYAASKAGVIGLTKEVAVEMARYGVTVNALAPGYIMTDMMMGYPEEQKAKITASIPVGYWAKPEDIAYWAGVLASPRAHYMTGAVIDCNGGVYM